MDEGIQKHETTWAAACHLGSFAGFFVPLGNIIVPLVIWLIKKEESSYISFHARESLNFQISILIYSVISAILIFVFIGIPLLIAILVFNFIAVIIAAVKAANGEQWQYPMTIRFVK